MNRLDWIAMGVIFVIWAMHPVAVTVRKLRRFRRAHPQEAARRDDDQNTVHRGAYK